MEESKDLNEKPTPIEATPSGSNDLSKTLPEEAFNHFLQGKRHIVVQDYKFAVQSLSIACEMYTKHFGEMAIECAEVHFLYGKALFRLSQQVAGVLGGALNEEVTEDEEQEKSSEEDSKENESEKNGSDTENGEENPEEEVEEEKEPSESTDSPQTAAADDSSKEATEKEPEPADDVDKSVALDESKVEEEQQPEQEEEADDLELAWNSLETAKSIFLRQGEDNVEAQLKVAEILQLLAEISMESDNNLAAIQDLKECLVIKRLHLAADDRILAETIYQMGLAQMLEKMYDDALENFSKTMSILQLRIDNLRSSPVKDTVGNFERADQEKEISDLESVLEDIREKIEDTKALQADQQKAIKEEISKKLLGEEEVGFSTAGKTETTVKPVTNINHLLKRKKPEQEEEKEKDSKRIKLTPDVTSNGVK